MCLHTVTFLFHVHLWSTYFKVLEEITIETQLGRNGSHVTIIRLCFNNHGDQTRKFSLTILPQVTLSIIQVTASLKSPKGCNYFFQFLLGIYQMLHLRAEEKLSKKDI